MRAFRFRLQRILDLRLHHLERARVELAAARRTLEARAVDRREAEQRASIASDALRIALDRGLEAGELVARQEGIERLRAEVAASRQAWEEALRELDRARARVMEAQRSARVLERLRDRALAAHRQELARREQRILDEVGVQTWLRGEGSR